MKPHARPGLFHHAWTEQRWSEPAEVTLRSPLFALHMSSDVDPVHMAQIRQAREVLRRRDAADMEGAIRHQRGVVERFLTGRSAYFGPDECQPLDDVERLRDEGRDVFVVVKFMDEAPHIAATFHSLLNQRGVDLRRVVIVAVDNNSTDGSDQIVKSIISANKGAARIVYMNQPRPGAGNAARLGVDRCVATVQAMCALDGDWSRLQKSLIALSDGDTVYHPRALREVLRIFDECPTVDGVMPFLTYKATAALRLFAAHRPAPPEVLARYADLRATVPVSVDLSGIEAFDELPRWRRKRVGNRMEIGSLSVELRDTDDMGRRFGVLRDPSGRLAYVLEDRTIVLAEAPASGLDAALVFLENGLVRRDEKWRWHAVVGHDIFLTWLFAGMGASENMIYPDTSDALKTFRTWAFSIGGQHQLRRPELRIVTGSDYQSGRILQATGCTVRLGPAEAHAETEIDRLIKMARNLMRQQAVFYGRTRGSVIERASGLYVHMTRIQENIEAEVRRYDDAAFEKVIFPERILFPLRWIFQNAFRFYAHSEPEARRIVREQLLDIVFGDAAAAVEKRWFTPAAVDLVARASHDDRPDVAERLAEELIAEHHPEIMRCYQRTLRDFFARQRVPADRFEWLLTDLDKTRNALRERPSAVDPATVWDGEEFEIDIERGQAVSMRPADGPSA
ncbi:glycosyltransferase family A protein [Nonomuraea sp. NPDC049400]|uniref:glycosyltransferase family A protein n=1 Tax=Nonomuraea sp. NPDC049400 TaxID=3364352 RepID=UPI0037AF3E10